MIIFNHIDFINYNTHVSFSHIGLKILIVFVWSIFLQLAFKHWQNMNVLIIINNIIFSKWKMIPMWQTSPKLNLGRRLTNPFPFIQHDSLRIKMFFLTTVSPYFWNLNHFFFLLIKHLIIKLSCSKKSETEIKNVSILDN